MKTIFLLLIVGLLLFISCKQQLESRLATDLIDNGVKELTGAYMGQSTPDSIPELFAPNIISNGLINRDITFTPQGDEIDFTFSIVIIVTQLCLPQKWLMAYGAALK